jgi:hypothetical protein
MKKSKENKTTRVCIVDTIYTLFVYLLYSSEDELKHTYYFFTNGVAKSIRDKFASHYFFDVTKKINKNIFWRIINLYIIGYFRWPFLRTAEIFGHDQTPLSTFIIRKRNYTYIEEAPKRLSVYLGEKLYSDLGEFWSNNSFHATIRKFLYHFISGVYMRPVANNTQCKAVILTEDDEVPYIAEKAKHVIPLSIAWKNSSEEKKQYILDIYEVSKDTINALQDKTYIFLAQQFNTVISDTETINIYKEILKKYDPACMVIKSHPRDTIDYKKYFPGIFVFDKPIPMQLLLLIGGLNFKKAITIFSSAVNMFPDSVEKEWIGSAIHPLLYERYPNLEKNIRD